MLQLRDHQLDVIEKLRQGFKDGHRSQLLYAPTGYGKTELAIYLMKATAEKGKRCAMIMDRIVLVDQTSERLDKYGLAHGVYQSQHWKFNTSENIQICSAQTLESRKEFLKMDLLIVDECHITRKQISELILNNPKLKVIGLTATPFTKGLGKLYTNVVCGSTTEQLVMNKWLAPLKVYIAQEISMKGARKLMGEWSPEVVTERAMKLTGDIVQEWIKMTHEIFGKPRKTIVFAAGVAHSQDLVQQFAEKGYNFVSISYLDNSEFKRNIIEDFKKPDTTIHGLIATDILTRGFDVPDVMIGVSARPFAKSLSSHIQQMGRVMRSSPNKEFGLWLDHSGNILRFRSEWEDIYQNGVSELNDELESKSKKEPTEREKHEAKCPSCAALWTKGSFKCSECGYVKTRQMFSTSVGEMIELSLMSPEGKLIKQSFFSELLHIAQSKNYSPHWASHKYREKFGVFPKGLDKITKSPSIETMNWIKHKMIAYSKAMKKDRKVA